MLTSSIGWILVVSGLVTAGGGLVGLVSPKLILRLVFGVQAIDGPLMFFTRHWAALLFVVCALTAYSGYFPNTRVPILTASIIEKCVIVALIFFGPIKRTVLMTMVGTLDGILVILFTAYLAGI